MARAIYDWDGISDFYDAGHSLIECRERFGFSRGAWNKAIKRGDVIPRRGREPGRTRRQVERMLADGASQADIARELGRTPAAISHHAKELGVPVREECARRYDWQEVQRYYDRGHAMRACMRRFGFSSETWHQAKLRGDVTVRPRAAPIETYLVKGRCVARSHLKGRLVGEGLKENRCEECGLDEWRGRPLPLALHHVNGDGDDNRLENLQLLCGNCHSQTPNWSGKNRGRPRLPRGAVWIRNVPHRRLPVRGTCG